LEAATKNAINVPFRIMEVALQSMEVMLEMAKIGNPASASDAGVGAACARTAVLGAYLNVKINTNDLKDKDFVNEKLIIGGKMLDQASQLEQEILTIVLSKM